MESVAQQSAGVRRRVQSRAATPSFHITNSGVSEQEEEALQATLPSARVHGRDAPSGQTICARPQCTDCSSLLIFVVFNMSLAWQASRLKGSDLRRLTNGIDFQNKICGMSDSVQGPDANGGDFLYWCSQENAVQLDSPICVPACPFGGEHLMCPVPHMSTDVVERHDDGEISIKRVHVQRLVPHSALPTRQFGKICIPESLSPQRLLNLILGAANHGSSLVLRAGQMASLSAAPHLMVVLITIAASSGLMYIFFLRAFMRIFMIVLLFLSCMFLVRLGVFLLLSKCTAETEQSICLAAAQAQKYGQMNESKFQAADMFSEQFAFAVQAHLPFAESSSSWCIFLGALSLIMGLWVLPRFFYASRQKMSLAVDTVTQGCTIVFGAPALTFLPMCECALRGGLFVLAVVGALTLLSTAEVHASPVSIFGKTVAGIPRSFSPTADLVLCLVTYIFAWIWLQELLSAVFTYVIARATALSYFYSAPQPQGSTMMAMMSATLYHLGSFAKGAFENACRYIPRWITLGSDDYSYAYIDMAITSSALQPASSNASKLLAKNRLVMATRGMLLGPMMQICIVVFVAAFWITVYMLLLLMHKSLRSMDAPEPCWQDSCWSLLMRTICLYAKRTQIAEELEAVESLATAAAVAATISFFICQSFTMVINRVADAVLYCSLVEQQSGSIIEQVPDALRNMARYQVNTRDFLCPISHDIMADPVVAADGHTYDRNSILQWLSRSNRSPMTNLVLEHQNLVPNIVIRQQIQAL